jgi:hypothetical protein
LRTVVDFGFVVFLTPEVEGRGGLKAFGGIVFDLGFETGYVELWWEMRNWVGLVSTFEEWTRFEDRKTRSTQLRT